MKKIHDAGSESWSSSPITTGAFGKSQFFNFRASSNRDRRDAPLVRARRPPPQRVALRPGHSPVVIERYLDSIAAAA